MTAEEMIEKVKQHLKLNDNTRDLIISDVVIDVMNYCHILDLPENIEPFVRKKVQWIIEFEQSPGYAFPLGVKSIKDGDGSINFDDSINKETIYGLSDKDKAYLRRFRKVSNGV